jgi:hypothetical protein
VERTLTARGQYSNVQPALRKEFKYQVTTVEQQKSDSIQGDTQVKKGEWLVRVNVKEEYQVYKDGAWLVLNQELTPRQALIELARVPRLYRFAENTATLELIR